VPNTPIVSSFVALLQRFAPHFTEPTFRTFLVLACGWVLALGPHMVTTAVRGAAAMGSKHISSFHRFFSKAKWDWDALSRTLVRMIDALVPRDESLVVTVDDTLGRHTGKKIAAASMHRDPLQSTATRVAFHWGHLWVVLGITVRLFGKNWCLPVLVRLYRSKKVCEQQGLRYRRLTELAAELIALLAAWLPHRRITVVGDGAYTNSSVIHGRPSNVTYVGRSRLDAAIYAPAPPRMPGQMGRPRVRGARLPSPGVQANAKDAPWQAVEVTAYGRTAVVKVLVINALWYSVAPQELVRLVVVRDFPGHKHDDVLACTDTSMTPKDIIELYACRWSMEVTFQETKGKLGFDEPRSRTESAVERTTPFTLFLYSLVVLWYASTGCKLRSARPRAAPWYSPTSSPSKTLPAFSDMLATLRRASWAERLLQPHANDAAFKKLIQPLLLCLDTAA
jgi:hypothetical protein